MIASAGDVVVAYPLFYQAESGGSIPTSALQLNVVEIGMRRAAEMNKRWHSVLPETHLGNLVGNACNVAYAAEFDGLFYGVAIWTTPIAANRLQNGSAALELRRMAIGESAPKNTASRMLAVMRRLIQRRFPNIDRLISYQAIDHHAGTIYRAAGWEPTAQSKATQWHEKESRAEFQTCSPKIRWDCYLHNKPSETEPQS